MSIFSTTILLATDGSRETGLAATTAVDLANSTNSELHIVHVGEFVPTLLAQTEVEPAQLERGAQQLLDEQVRRLEEAGGTVKEAHLRLGRADRDRRLGPRDGGRVYSDGQQGPRQDDKGAYGKRV
jgi:nucleotide-binding universal stress UspA family protein